MDSIKELFKSYENNIIILGPVLVDVCPYIYDQWDALFHPILLECFNASYTEAMKMQKPILTSALFFKRYLSKYSTLFRSA